MTQNRGKLLYQGITGDWWRDTLEGKIKVFILSLNAFIILIILTYLSFKTGQLVLESVCLFTATISLFMVWALGGFEFDRIYENGITSGITTLLERIMGKNFHPYENITKIGYGTRISEGKKTEFIVLYENYSEKPTIRNYTKNDFKNDFYDRLIEALKENCPNAVWEEVDWESLPFWRK